MFASTWKFLLTLCWIAFAILLVFFSVNNRQEVTISLEPFGYLPGVPLYWLLFMGIFIGLAAAGAVTGWLRLKGFAERRKAERRATYLEGQVSALSEDAHKQRARDAHEAASDAPSIAPPR